MNRSQRAIGTGGDPEPSASARTVARLQPTAVFHGVIVRLPPKLIEFSPAAGAVTTKSLLDVVVGQHGFCLRGHDDVSQREQWSNDLRFHGETLHEAPTRLTSPVGPGCSLLFLFFLRLSFGSLHLLVPNPGVSHVRAL